MLMKCLRLNREILVSAWQVCFARTLTAFYLNRLWSTDRNAADEKYFFRPRCGDLVQANLTRPGLEKKSFGVHGVTSRNVKRSKSAIIID